MIGEASALGAAFAWAIGGFFGKALTLRIGVLWTTLLRAGAGALLAWALLGALGAPSLLTGFSATAWSFLLASSLLFTGWELLFMAAVHQGDVSQVFPIIVSIYIFLGTVVSTLLLGEPLSLTTGVGGALVVAGVALVASTPATSPSGGRSCLLGPLLAVLAGVLGALGVILMKQALREVPIPSAVAVRLVVPFLLLLAWAGVARSRPRGWGETGSALSLTLANGLFFGVSVLLSFTALHFTTVARMTILSSTAPVWTASLSPLFGERMGLRRLAGTLVAVVGTWLTVGGPLVPLTGG